MLLSGLSKQVQEGLPISRLKTVLLPLRSCHLPDRSSSASCLESICCLGRLGLRNIFLHKLNYMCLSSEAWVRVQTDGGIGHVGSLNKPVHPNLRANL